MEIKINKEIRNYTESMFFGLSMRQFFFAVIGVGFAVVMYFLLRPYLGTETLSWVCTYNGMTEEQFAWTWIKSKFIEPQKVKFECDTFYNETLQKQAVQKSIKKEG